MWKFITPVIKTFRGGKEVGAFFTEAECAAWAATQTAAFESRFLKGLGSHEPPEARAYFADLGRHLKQVSFSEAGKAALNMFFDKRRADDRKKWMALPQPAPDYSSHKIDTLAFVESELRAFANAQVHDLIPGFLDGSARGRTGLTQSGLKPVQRKILHVMRKHPAKEWKIPSLSGILVAEAAYHHGETSAHDAIIGLAACYPTSNNVPLLVRRNSETEFGLTQSRPGTAGRARGSARRSSSSRAA